MIRRLSYPDAEIFILCFNICDPESFRRIRDKWAPELREYCPKVPVVLVGTQARVSKKKFFHTVVEFVVIFLILIKKNDPIRLYLRNHFPVDQRNNVDVKCKLNRIGSTPISTQQGMTTAKKIGARKVNITTFSNFIFMIFG